MNKSEHKPTQLETSDTLAESVMAAMKRAQRNAARENARYGMSLILEKARPKRKVRAKRKTPVRAATPAAASR